MNNISIVIPVFNSEKTIGKTIEACLAQSYPSDKIEIILVDDNSTDRTSEIAKKYPVKYLHQTHGGPAKARNTGWRAAKGEIIFFTDSDCVPEKDWVKKMTAFFDAYDIAAIGGSYDIMNPESIVALCIHYEIQYRHSMIPEFVKYLGSFNIAVKKSVLQEVGGFDESFKIACGEDADLAYRISDKSYRLRFCPENRVGHFFPTHLIGFLKQQFMRGFWIMKLLQKHSGKLGKDDYSRTRDVIQPPLYFLIMLLIPFCFISSMLSKIWLVLNLAGILIHYPVVKFSLEKSRKLKLLFIFILLYLRGFYWAAGCFVGFFKFRKL
ncbi:MAG: glycosyltransferase [Elusimicrobiota bacterium]